MVLLKLFSRRRKPGVPGPADSTVAQSCCASRADPRRRSLLAAMLGMAPLLSSLLYPARARAAGEPVRYDLTDLLPGQAEMIEWQGKPVWIVHRTPQMLADLRTNTPDLEDPQSEHSAQPAYAAGETRSLREDFFVCIGMCTHMGCAISPKLKTGPGSGMGEEWTGGFLCPCHGSRFDLAGRVYKGMPALVNLEVPPYRQLDGGHLLIGQDVHQT
jgi:ubiquinol-cytochrome c reductase iron-sulfur subunit